MHGSQSQKLLNDSLAKPASQKNKEVTHDVRNEIKKFGKDSHAKNT